MRALPDPRDSSSSEARLRHRSCWVPPRREHPRSVELLMVVGAVTFLTLVALGLPSTSMGSTEPRSTPATSGAPEEPSASTTVPRAGAAPGSAGWENFTPATLPSSRYGEAVGYDGADGYLVLFGGQGFAGGVTPLDDTWAYHNGTWTNITATAGTPPPGRAYAYLVYDAKDGYLVLVGGMCPGAVSCNDTWEFHGGRWSPLRAAPVDPAAGEPIAAYDSTDGYVVTANCDPSATYRFSGGNWSNTSVAAPPGCSAAISDDPANHGVVFDGGLQGNVYNATWLFSAGNWTNVTSTSGSPPSGIAAATQSIACYDPDLGAVVQVGPGARLNYSNLGTALTSLYNGTWTNATGPLAPPWDVYPGFAWDPEVDGAVLVDLAWAPSVWVFSSHPALVDLSISTTTPVVDVGASDGFSATFLGGTPPFALAWTFGDGATGTGATVQHAYSSPGTFLVGVTVVDGTNSSTNTATTVQVVPALTAAPTATPDPTEVGVGTTFAAGLTGGAGSSTYNWTFGDGSSSDAAVAEHTFRAAGTYAVNVTASDYGGSVTRASVSLTVAPALSVSISMDPAAPDLGQLTNFSANISGGVGSYRISWAFGDGGIGGNLSQISHIYTTDGPFDPVVTVIDSAGGRANASTTVNIALNLSVIGNWSMGAAPLPVSFGSHVRGGHPGYRYAWSFGDGATSAVAAPSHTYDEAGYFQANLTVTDSAGTTARASWPLYVAVGGVALEVGVVATPGEIAPGGSFVVTAQPAGGTGGYVLNWSTGSASCVTSGLASLRCTTSGAAQYTVGVVVTDGSGAEALGSAVVVAGTPATLGPASSAAILSPLETGVLVGVALGAALALCGVLVTGRHGRRVRPRGSVHSDSPAGADADSSNEPEPFDDLV